MSIDTVACAVNYMDRYLSEFKADKVLLQLLAMVCLSLASKMFETQPITMDEMRMLSRGAFQKVDIRDVEKQVLLTTNWNLNPITAQSVARHVLALEPDFDTRVGLEPQVFDMLSMALKDHSFLNFKPSTLALASVFAAHMKSNRAVGSTLRTIISSFAWSSEDVRTCQRAFLDATTPQVHLSLSLSPFIDTTNVMTLPHSTPYSTKDNHHHHPSYPHHSHRSDSPTAIEDFVQVMNDENKPPAYHQQYQAPQTYLNMNMGQQPIKPALPQQSSSSQPRTMGINPNHSQQVFVTPVYHSNHLSHHHHHHHAYTVAATTYGNTKQLSTSGSSSSSCNNKKRSRVEV